MSTALYEKVRPTKLDDVYGQDEAIKVLKGYAAKGWPQQVFMFTGPSGTGKSTLAKIVAKMVKSHKDDTRVINISDLRGIDNVRRLTEQMRLMAGHGKTRSLILDECQGMTKDAQSALLMPLEDTPEDVYIMLCTTDPQKLSVAIRNRCKIITTKPLSDELAMKLLKAVAFKEGISCDQDALDKIVELGEGSSRQLLVMLEAIAGVPKKEQLDTVVKLESEATTKQLCQALFNWKGQPSWKEVSAILRNCTDEPEKIRRAVVNYGAAILVNGRKDDRIWEIVQTFRDHVFDSGMGGIIANCYEIVVK